MTKITIKDTQNPTIIKFEFPDFITQNESFEFKNIDETSASPLAKELFKFPYVKEVFIDENYVSITKYAVNEWQEITLELRTFIKEFIENDSDMCGLSSTDLLYLRSDSFFDYFLKENLTFIGK